jgi:hypothetical protein
MSLKKITANCRLHLSAEMPALHSITFVDGFRPGSDDALAILRRGIVLKHLTLRDPFEITTPSIKNEQDRVAILSSL